MLPAALLGVYGAKVRDVNKGFCGRGGEVNPTLTSPTFPTTTQSQFLQAYAQLLALYAEAMPSPPSLASPLSLMAGLPSAWRGACKLLSGLPFKPSRSLCGTHTPHLN